MVPIPAIWRGVLGHTQSCVILPQLFEGDDIEGRLRHRIQPKFYVESTTIFRPVQLLLYRRKISHNAIHLYIDINEEDIANPIIQCCGNIGPVIGTEIVPESPTVESLLEVEACAVGAALPINRKMTLKRTAFPLCDFVERFPALFWNTSCQSVQISLIQ